MSLAQWIRPPRHVLVIFVSIMLVFGGALGWLAWRLVEQDRSLEAQRVQERLEQAADHIASALQQSQAELEAAGEEPPDGVVVLELEEGAVMARPPGRLLYYPVASAGEEPPAGTFAEGEALEFQRNDPGRAAETFRSLARSTKPAVRGGALLRLGRNLRKTGRYDDALQTYALRILISATSPAASTIRSRRSRVTFWRLPERIPVTALRGSPERSAR